MPVASKRELTQEDLERSRRLRDALASIEGLSQIELGKRIGLGEQGISRIMRGISVPKNRTLRGLCRELKISPQWLQHGIEPKELDPAWLERPLIVSMPSRVNPGLEAWLNGTPEGKAVSPDARQWLRAIPWPETPARQPDMAYYLAAQVYKNMFPATDL